MMTVHAAKGLEFPVVFVLSVAPRRFPSTDRKPLIEFPDALRRAPAPPANIHLEEERRLFYVALTRARECLFISSVSGAGKKPSPFIQDLLGDPVINAKDLERLEFPAVQPGVAPAFDPSQETARMPAPQRGPLNLFDSRSAGAERHAQLAAWSAHQPALEKDGKLGLSASAIETYLECPLKFKLAYVEKIPTGPQAALTFGNVMHQAVRHYFELRKQKEPAEEEIADFYLRAWRSAGFEDSYQEQAYKQSGLEQLREFVSLHNRRSVDADALRFEQAFAVDLGAVTLEGRIDQVQPVGSRAARTVELVDYKTGRPRAQKDADSSLQLSVYALAARECFSLDPVRLTFYNLADNEAVSSARTPKDLDQVRAKIHEVAEDIRHSLFNPKPGYACKFCDFVPICPVHEEG